VRIASFSPGTGLKLGFPCTCPPCAAGHAGGCFMTDAAHVANALASTKPSSTGLSQQFLKWDKEYGSHLVS